MINRQESLILNAGIDFILHPPEDTPRTLADAVNRFRRGTWILPDHQRDFVWTDSKVRSWIDRLALATQQPHRKPVGVIVTYQINDGNPSNIYINDGSQRMRASLRVFDEPATFGYDRETIEKIFDVISIPVQHRHYRNHDEALQDFQLLNLGTSLTPREMCKGILVNAPEWAIWKPLFDRVHHEMRTIGGGLVAKAGEKRDQIHKHERHDFSLIIRWLTNEPLADYREVATSSLSKDDIDNGTTIEHRLRKVCAQHNPHELRLEIDKLIAHIQRNTALFRDIWEDERPSRAKALSVTLFRWILDISIWARQTQVPHAVWEEFVRKLLRYVQGNAVVQNLEDMTDRVTLALGSAAKLKRVCLIIGSDMYQGRPQRKRSRSPRLPGYDESHELPFVTNGNGPTRLEPAGRNRSRGAKPIETDD